MDDTLIYRMGCGQETSLPKSGGTSYFPDTFNKSKMQKWLTKIIYVFFWLDDAFASPFSLAHIKEMLVIGVLLSVSVSIMGLRNGLSVFILSKSQPKL